VEETLRLLEAREARHDSVAHARIEGEASGEAGPLDFSQIKQKAREQAGADRRD
jgi:Arc/MetJ-type ribon-helix-helix transcriptional regulator